MAVRIRLKRQGREKRPFYRIVVMDSRTRRDGREIEKLGWYDPLQGAEVFELNEDRALYWLGEGASPSLTVNTIFKTAGLALRWHLMKLNTPEEEIEAALATWRENRVEKRAATTVEAAPPVPLKKDSQSVTNESDAEKLAAEHVGSVEEPESPAETSEEES